MSSSKRRKSRSREEYNAALDEIFDEILEDDDLAWRYFKAEEEIKW